MAQAPDYTVVNAGGSSVRAELNAILAAIQSSNGGASAPPSPAPGMMWLDTSASPAVLKIRDAANTAWIVLAAETMIAKSVRGNVSASPGPAADIDMVSLASMLGFSQSLSVAPYLQRLPGGLMMTWGSSSAIPAGGGTSIVFASAFPTAAHGVLAVPITGANNASGFTVGVRALTASGAILTNNSGTSGSVQAFWLALGA